MLQGVSERLTALIERVRASASKQGSTRRDGFLARPDALGRMEVVTVGPGFNLHLRHVNEVALSRDKLSGNFRFKVDMADRETVAHEQIVHAALDEISKGLGLGCPACDDVLVSPEERANCKWCHGTTVVLEELRL
jgi:hypothetical protein